MDPVVIVALIAAAASVICAGTTALIARKGKVSEEEQKFRQAVTTDLNDIKEQQKLSSYRLGKIETKVDAHNNFDTRIAVVETKINGLEVR